MNADAIDRAAVRAMDQLAPEFGIRAPALELRRLSVITDSVGTVHLTYQQVHHGIDVFSGILKVHLDAAGELRIANGRFYPLNPDFSTQTELDADAAGQAATHWTGGLNASPFETRLVIVDPGWYGDPGIGPRLAYLVSVMDDKGLEDALFIDAHTGDVLDRWSLRCSLVNREVYDAFGQSDLPGGLIRHEGDPPNGDPEIDRVYDYLGDAYEYYVRAFNRDSYDDAGSPIRASTYYNTASCQNSPNAFWSNSLRQIGFCQETTYDDVIAHEFTHGVTQYTANLIYQNQSGQLNESFSDIFGELVDLFNSDSAFAGTNGTTPWTPHESGSGTDAPNNLRTANCSPKNSAFPNGVRWLIAEDSPRWPNGLRDMWRPTCFLHPDRANSTLQTCSYADYGGVHSGSGVLNHAFAIACDGKTFNGYSVAGIGPIKAGAIWYRALSTYLTVASDFADAYVALNQAAGDLLGTQPLDPRTGWPSPDAITASDAAEVDKALRAVELNTSGLCGESIDLLNSTPPPDCASRSIVFSDDFESGAPGWTLENTAVLTPYNWVLTSPLPYGRPGTAWFCPDLNIGNCDGINDEQAVHSLVSPTFAIPSGWNTLTLRFTHFVETESRFDGGNLSLRVNAGPWQFIPTVAYYYNRYNTSLYAAQLDNTNPLAGQAAFSGVGGRWGTSLVDLGAFVVPGDEIQIRFDFGKDSCYGITGWYLDDVELFACDSSGDCNRNGLPDEIDAGLSPGPTLLLHQELNHSSGNLSDADPDPNPSLGVNKLAEDFSIIRPVLVTSLKVFGAYTSNTIVPDSFTVNFYDAAAGVPGALRAAYPVVSSTRVMTNRAFLGLSEFEYVLTLPTPVSLTPGEYFVEIFNDTTGSPTTWVWERALFGWIPGCARFGQGCQTYCRDDAINFSLDLIGQFDGIVRADVNLNDMVNLDDVEPFIEVLLNGPASPDHLCAADVDGDGDADGDDIRGFVDCILGFGCP